MSLRTILLNKQIRDKEAELEALREKTAGFEVREADLAKAIEEASTEEERSAVEEAVSTLETEQQEATQQRSALEGEIAELRAKLTEAEAAQAEAMNNENQERNDAHAGAARQRKDNTMNQMELREAENFQKTGRHTYSDVRSILRAAVKSSTTGVIGPTGVGGINDAIGSVSALVDMIKMTDCTGMAAYKVAVMTADASDAASITEGNAPSESEPTFASVDFAPANYGTIGYISKEIRKQSPLDYEEKVRESARRALRRKLNGVAVNAILASTLNTTHALTTSASSVSDGGTLFDAKLLSNIILAYGGDEGVEGAACLYLNKADLKAFAAVRGTNEYLPVYTITPDVSNPSTGIIKDNNGLSCRYCLTKDLTALSTATLTTTATKHMFYGNPQCAEMAIWGGYDVEVNDGYKFAEGLITVRGEVTADVDVTVKNGFVVVTGVKAS